MIQVYMMKSEFTRGDYGMIGYKEGKVLAIKACLAIDANAYEYVGDVDSNDLEKAWELTNSFDFPWYTDPKIHNFKGMKEAAGRCRSAMVGDIYVMDDVAYIVAPFGV